MVKRIEFQGAIHEFPDGVSDDQIASALRSGLDQRGTDQERTGRLRTASSQFARGVSDVVTGSMKSVPIAQSKNRGEMAELFSRIDAGQDVRDPFDPMPVRQEIIAEYAQANPERKAEMRVSYANPGDPREAGLYRAADSAQQAVEDAMPVDPEYSEEFWAGSVPRGLGTTVGFAGVGMLGRGAGLGATLPAGVAGAAMSSAGQFEDALASGASFEDAFEASGYGGMTGAIEGIPIGRLFDRLDKITGGSVKRTLIEAVKQGSEEAIQEFVQTVGDNLIANNLVAYDPERGTFEGAGEASGTGFTVGALMQLVGGLVVGRRARNASATDDAQAEEVADQAQEQEQSVRRPENVPADYTPFYEADGKTQLGWISPDRMHAIALNGGSDMAAPAPAPVGEREAEAAKAPDISAADEASPIDTADIAAGKKFIADGEASERANRSLRGAGFPVVNSRITVDMPNGISMPGTVMDAATENGDTWAKIQLDTGATVEEPVSSLQGRVRPLTDDMAATNQQPAQDEQIESQAEVLRRGGFPDLGARVSATFPDGTSVTGSVEGGYYLDDDTPAMRLRGDDGSVRAVAQGQATIAPEQLPEAPQQQENLAQAIGEASVAELNLEQTDAVSAADTRSEQNAQMSASMRASDAQGLAQPRGIQSGQVMTGTGLPSGPVGAADSSITTDTPKQATGQEDQDNPDTDALVDIKAVSREMNEIFSRSDAEAVKEIMSSRKLDAETAVSEYAERQAIQDANDLREITADERYGNIPFDAAEEAQQNQNGRNSGTRRTGRQGSERIADEGPAISPPSAQTGRPSEEARSAGAGSVAEFIQPAIPVASWVIRNKSTGEVVMETFDRAKVDALNTDKYEAVPIQEYLASLNKPKVDGTPPPRQETKTPAIAAGVSDSGKKSDTASDEGKNVKSGSGEEPSYSISNPSNQFARELDRFLRGDLSVEKMLQLGETPDVLRLVGAPDKRLAVSQKVVRKIIKDKHAVHPDTLANLPELIADPVMVLRSATRPDDSVVVVIDAMDLNGDPVLATVVIGKDNMHVNAISSMYGKGQRLWFDQQVKAGSGLYLNKKKSPEWLRRSEVQFPGWDTIQSSNPNIRTEDDLVKYRQKSADNNASVSAYFDVEQLKKRLADVGLQEKIAVKVVDQIMGGQAEASYVDGVISIAMTAENPVRALDHEIIHALRDLGVIRDLEWKAVSRAAMKDRARVEDIKTRYKDLKLNDDQIAEEAVAEMFADLGTKNSGAIKRTVKRIANFFEAMGIWLRGSGFRSADDVFGAINRGDVGGRQQDGESLSEQKYSLVPQKKLSPFDEMVLRPSRSVIEAMTTSTGGMIDALKAGTSTKAIGESVDRWRTAFQDQYLPLMRVQNAVEESIGRKLRPDENAYIGEELSSGRKGAKLEDVAEKHVRPLIEEMHAKGIKVEELEAFLYARHAPERNKRISEINPKFKPGEGSGMTDAEAAGIMKEVRASGRFSDYQALAKQVDAILELGMKERVDAGLMSQEQADQWKKTYAYYVPLRGRSEVDPFSGSDRPRQGGSGISVAGKESQMAFGRKTPARDILAYAIMQTEEAIIRAETNRVAQRVFALAEAAPDDRFWKINKVKYKPVLDKATDTVVYRPVNAITAEDRDFTIVAKFDGKQRRLTFNPDNPTAARVAASLRNLEGEKITAIVKYGGGLNRFLSMVNTSLNPEFVITNAFRDLQTAGINLAQYDEKGLVRNTLKDYPKALAGSMKGAFGKDDGSDWVKAYNEFRMAGGRVYFNQIEDVNQQAKKLKRAFDEIEGKGGARRKVRAVFNVIENVNLGVESAIRLSAFKNARKAGMSPEQAASLAKNLTVNFNRRGTYGPLMNSAYLFFNASVQGSTVLLQAAKSRRVQKVLGAAVVTGALVEIMNVMASAYDDDGELIYDKISDFDKSRNIIIMIPGGDGQHVKIPLPYGYNAFFATGRAMVEGYRGKEFGDIFGPLATTVIDSFNPIGGSEGILKMISPTITDPLVELDDNKDFAGRPIMPKQSEFGPQIPDSQRYWNSVSPVWREITDFLNEASGGDIVRPGAVDISPETLEHIFGVATGAAGSFVDRNVGLISKLIDPASDVSMNDIAFARKIIGQKPTWYDKGAAYERMDRIEQVHADLKEYADRGMGQEADQLVDEQEDLLALRGMARSARRALSQIRKEKDSLVRAYDDSKISKAEYTKAYESLKEAEKSVLVDFNTAFIKATQGRE